MLQESEAKALGRYGAVGPADASLLDHQIEKLTRLVLESENVFGAA
jgi:hypothetical protein